MDLNSLKDIPPWEWPENAGRMFLGILRDGRAGESDRLLAAELAGDSSEIDDELTAALLSIVLSDGEPEKLRATAVISLGTALEEAFMEGFDIPGDAPITEDTFLKVQKSLYEIYMDTAVPEEMRRRTLEASARAHQDWHRDAVSFAYASDDKSWRLTAIFCMGYIGGFDEQILEALESEDPDLVYEALHAVIKWELDAAWPRLTSLVAAEGTDKDVLIAAINAIAEIRPWDAGVILSGLTESKDDDIACVAGEAIVMAAALSEDMDEDDDSTG